MADSTNTVTAPGSLADPGAGPVKSRPQGRSGPAARAAVKAAARYAGILPFTAYVVLGLIIPMIAVAVGAFQDPDTGGWTLHNIDLATHGVYLTGFRESIVLSVLSAVLPAIFGLLIAIEGGWFSQHWLHAKLVLVVLMQIAHALLARWRRAFAEDRNVHSARFYRFVNEVPTVLMIGIVILVIVKPF